MNGFKFLDLFPDLFCVSEFTPLGGVVLVFLSAILGYPLVSKALLFSSFRLYSLSLGSLWVKIHGCEKGFVPFPYGVDLGP